MLGGSLVVRCGSVIVLVNSAFESNSVVSSTVTDGVGIVNFDGQVQCDVQHCLPVCTACRDGILSPRPTLQPTVASVSKTEQKNYAPAWTAFSWGCSLGLFFLVATWMVRRHPTRCQRSTVAEFPEEAREQAAEQQTAATLVQRARADLRRQLRAGFDATDEEDESDASSVESEQAARFLMATYETSSGSDDASVELVHATRFLMASYETSSAPIVVVGRSAIGITIKLWSVGMSNTVPMRTVPATAIQAARPSEKQAGPVGWLVTDLPFVNAHDGTELVEKLGKTFDSPGKHDNARPCMLHLRTQNGAVLLEMTLSVFVTTEPVIVMAGREVDSSFAGFLCNEEDGSVAPSELQSSISSVTMPSMGAETNMERYDALGTLGVASEDAYSQLLSIVESGNSPLMNQQGTSTTQLPCLLQQSEQPAPNRSSNTSSPNADKAEEEVRRPRTTRRGRH